VLRQEHKYLLHRNDEFIFSTISSLFLKEDPAMTSEFGYEVSSLYFDDPELTCISQKKNGSHYKQKFRIRFYNQDKKLLFLEVKIKNGEFSHKSRGVLETQNLDPLKDNQSLIRYLYQLKSDDPAIQQFLYFYHRLRLQPLLWVHYKRQAYICPFGSGLRLTMDRSMRGHFFLSQNSVSFGEPSTLLEIKIKKFIPTWLQLFLSETQARRISFSKYYECYESLQRSSFASKKSISNMEGYI
jgi:SPX domain protein involved in polyphosphate accumulation